MAIGNTKPAVFALIGDLGYKISLEISHAATDSSKFAAKPSFLSERSSTLQVVKRSSQPYFMQVHFSPFCSHALITVE